MGAATRSFEQLHKLQLQLQDVEQQLQRGPKQVEARRQLVERKKAELEGLRAQLMQLRKAADQKSLQLHSNESKIADLKVKLNMASSNREFEIIKTQIDADSMANSVLEDEILEALDKVDQKQTAIARGQKELAEAEQQRSRMAEQVQAAEPGLRQRMAELQAAVKVAEEALPKEPKEIGQHYRRLVQAHGAGALAAVENNACTACYAILERNALVELNTGKIIFCRSCGRLMYRSGGE